MCAVFYRVSTFLPHSVALGFVLDIGRFRKALSLPTLHPERPHSALLNAVFLWATRLSKNWRQHENLFFTAVDIGLAGRIRRPNC